MSRRLVTFVRRTELINNVLGNFFIIELFTFLSTATTISLSYAH